MPLIAIVKNHSENYSDGYYASDPIVESITDWSEVTTKELQLLKNYLNSYDYSIIERIDVDKEFIPKTVAQALVEAKLAEQKELQRKEEAERKKLAAALKKKAKTEEQEKKLLEELQAKYKG